MNFYVYFSTIINIFFFTHQLYVNGDVVATYRNGGPYIELSQDWDGKVGLGT